MSNKNSFEKSEDAVIDVCDLILKLWFFIHLDKSQSIPVQKNRVFTKIIFRIYFRFHIDVCVFDRSKTTRLKH